MLPSVSLTALVEQCGSLVSYKPRIYFLIIYEKIIINNHVALQPTEGQELPTSFYGLLM